eukprot:6184967-Pleurochrysis_carterae.AAC.3
MQLAVAVTTVAVKPATPGAHRYTARRETESPLDHGVAMRFRALFLALRPLGAVPAIRWSAQRPSRVQQADAYSCVGVERISHKKYAQSGGIFAAFIV